MSRPSIFVSIASYRDLEAPPTLADLFAKAAYPERVHAGVLFQVVPGTDDDCTALPAGHAERIRSRNIHAAESLGVCWARHFIQTQMYAGEDYFLQIDSHSRFAPGWDEMFVKMLRACPSQRAVLSTYPIGYKPPDKLNDPGVPRLAAYRFNEAGVLLLKTRTQRIEDAPPNPMPNAFLGANCLFGPGAMVTDAPYDPHLYFHGEEITLAVRLWTHGYDLFTPNDVGMYHDYSTDRGRPRHWDDERDWTTLNRRSFARVRHILAEERAEPEALVEIERYGLGRRRSLADYQAFADVDFRSRRIGARAYDGRFPAPQAQDEEDAQMRRRFRAIYDENLWKHGETRCGPGSARRVTKGLRRSMARLFKELRIRSLVDAGCGDLNWIGEITDKLDLYLGYDLVPDLLEANRLMFRDRSGHLFALADVSRMVLPRVDAILCRHCLTHLPNQRALDALERFRRSGSRWLLATTYPGAENKDCGIAHWRPIDLTAAPFNLPKPRRLIADGPRQGGSRLGLWNLARC